MKSYFDQFFSGWAAVLIMLAVSITTPTVSYSSEYRAMVTKVYDGDTITVNIELGLGVVLSGQKIRLSGIDAPEVRGESKIAGIASRDWLSSVILGREVSLWCPGTKGKYGRWVGIIVFRGVNLNEKLVVKGLAIRREY